MKQLTNTSNMIDLSNLVNSPRTAVIELLTLCDLPTEDLATLDLRYFLGYGRRTELEGVVGLQVYGEVALLRSLAVTPAARGIGIGQRLVDEIEAYAWEQEVNTLYLLTTTAEPFFARRGYTVADRATAPEAIRNTSEFSDLCPASAVFMMKNLEGMAD